MSHDIDAGTVKLDFKMLDEVCRNQTGLFANEIRSMVEEIRDELPLRDDEDVDLVHIEHTAENVKKRAEALKDAAETYHAVHTIKDRGQVVIRNAGNTKTEKGED